ncbi:lipoprotein NlpD/LppB [Ferrigenium kumadai]|uniref:Lipoprotein NlpD/LppB n=1 Tax=Ferrigenium kumadai TaxID=1682490 RepID=A0AAN1SZR2_9PROT|nr:peptidoglycan DD-metalloendopeptidase family protein [Ferrigenium kumadai]BBI99551.1 lipoprotein NlpD/LppB [Ferrigenium kumadai]
MNRVNRFFALMAAAAVLAGCASSKQHAPVIEHGGAAAKSAVAAEAARKKASREKDWRPQVHIVEKGDTLYSIAFNYGLDYHELAELNGIQDPNVIQIGQQIRLFASAAAARPAAVESKPLVKDQPKVVKYAYNEAAAAQIDQVQQPGKTAAATPAKPSDVQPKPQPKSESKPADDSADADEALEWSMPAKGKVVGEFSESANRKGIDIAGKLGQPVFASAPGKVVYSGSGLRGYGKLVIIKHNNTYLSAYAHNDQVLVKEGQSVTRGQKIAEMGNTDADQVKLHFEVRRLGKPVDPAKYLPLGKS